MTSEPSDNVMNREFTNVKVCIGGKGGTGDDEGGHGGEGGRSALLMRPEANYTFKNFESGIGGEGGHGKVKGGPGGKGGDFILDDVSNESGSMLQIFKDFISPYLKKFTSTKDQNIPPTLQGDEPLLLENEE